MTLTTAKDVAEWLRSTEAMADAELQYVPRGMANEIADAIDKQGTNPDDKARIATQQEAIDELVEHIREQSTHCQTRIQDGIEMGATIWRLALEDVARENAALLSKHGERT